MAADESGEILKGTTLEVYRFLLKSPKPVGIREVQRALNLSSPSVATYHLSKLEDASLIKRENGYYVINKVLLENNIRIRRFLIPRYFFYAVFALTILIIELALIRPTVITREYFFTTIATLIFAVIFCYETAKIALKKGL